MSSDITMTYNGSRAVEYNETNQNRTDNFLRDISLVEGNAATRSRKFDSSEDSMNSIESIRMNVNQITFAVLISVLLAVDMLLVYALARCLGYYEKRGREFMRPYLRHIYGRRAKRMTPTTVGSLD